MEGRLAHAVVAETLGRPDASSDEELSETERKMLQALGYVE